MTRLKTLANARFVRERQTAREIILREKWIPDIVISRENKMFWDGCTARRPDGRRVILPDAVAQQMILMAKGGSWGDLGCVVLDWDRHAVIRELLDRKIPSEIRQWEPTKASGASA